MSQSAQQTLSHTVGPAPWYWRTFPTITGISGQQWSWSFLGTEGEFAYLVSFIQSNEPVRTRLVLNAYCRAFLVPPSRVGLWFPQDGVIRLLCFEPEQLPAIHLHEMPLDFKDSNRRYYAMVSPAC